MRAKVRVELKVAAYVEVKVHKGDNRIDIADRAFEDYADWIGQSINELGDPRFMVTDVDADFDNFVDRIGD